MTFLFPPGLWLTLVVPILIALYIWAQRRRQKYALRYASLSLVKEAMGRGPGIRRHIPPALFIAAMFFMTAAVRAGISGSTALALNTLANARHSAWVSIARSCGCPACGTNSTRSFFDAAISSRELSICWRAHSLERQCSSREFRWLCLISPLLKWRMGCPSQLLCRRVYGTSPVGTNC